MNSTLKITLALLLSITSSHLFSMDAVPATTEPAPSLAPQSKTPPEVHTIDDIPAYYAFLLAQLIQQPPFDGDVHLISYFGDICEIDHSSQPKILKLLNQNDYVPMTVFSRELAAQGFFFERLERVKLNPPGYISYQAIPRETKAPLEDGILVLKAGYLNNNYPRTISDICEHYNTFVKHLKSDWVLEQNTDEEWLVFCKSKKLLQERPKLCQSAQESIIKSLILRLNLEKSLSIYDTYTEIGSQIYIKIKTSDFATVQAIIKFDLRDESGEPFVPTPQAKKNVAPCITQSATQ